jgi:hypothetical protein
VAGIHFQSDFFFLFLGVNPSNEDEADTSKTQNSKKSIELQVWRIPPQHDESQQLEFVSTTMLPQSWQLNYGAVPMTSKTLVDGRVLLLVHIWEPQSMRVSWEALAFSRSGLFLGHVYSINERLNHTTFAQQVESNEVYAFVSDVRNKDERDNCIWYKAYDIFTGQVLRQVKLQQPLIMDSSLMMEYSGRPGYAIASSTAPHKHVFQFFGRSREDASAGSEANVVARAVDTDDCTPGSTTFEVQLGRITGVKSRFINGYVVLELFRMNY